MTADESAGQVSQSDLWREYGKVGFFCLTCDDRVYLETDRAECFNCGRRYDVEIEVTPRDE